MDSQIRTVLVFWALRHYLGKAVNESYRKSKRKFYTNLKGKLSCSLCGENMSWEEKRTIDHIIPKKVIWETGLVGLYFDHRNFRASHPDCNLARGSEIEELPPKIVAKLYELGYTPS